MKVSIKLGSTTFEVGVSFVERPFWLVTGSDIGGTHSLQFTFKRSP